MIATLDDDLIDSIISKFGSEVPKLNLSNNGIRCIKNIERFKDCVIKLNLSGNDLVDIRPLSHLLKLKELNLSENNILDTSPLQKLAELQILNLSGNKISACNNIKQLAQLHHLTTLSLVGNPICTTSAYPLCVFAILPNVTKIDNFDRSSIIGQHKKTQPLIEQRIKKQIDVDLSQPKISIPPSSSTSTIKLSTANTCQSCQHIILSLKTQLQAMEDAFALQERSLASSGHKSGLAVDLLNNENSNDNMNNMDMLSNTECFPYLSLLQQWRKQTMGNIISRLISDRNLQELISNMKKMRSQHQIETREIQTSLLSWKERSSASSEKSDLLNQQLKNIENKLIDEQNNKFKAEASLEKQKKGVQNLNEVLNHYKNELDGTVLNSHLVMMQSMQRLKAMEERLKISTERISFATSIIVQKEIMLRNSAATVEAESRMLNIKMSRIKEIRKRIKNKENKNDENSDDDDDDDDDDNDYDVSESEKDNINFPRISQLKILPEAEAILRAVFRGLDPTDSGTVPLNLLLSVLSNGDNNIKYVNHKNSDDNSDDDIDDNSDDNNDNDDDTQYELSTLLSNSCGINRWNMLLSNLRAMSIDKEISWGEFLLQFIPHKQGNNNYDKLNIDDLNGLRKEGLIGDLDWGVVPIKIITTSNYKNIEYDDHDLDEIRQLKSERSFLLNKLQTMSRTLERRAEVIKSYFENSLRKSNLRQNRMKSQINDFNQLKQVNESRIVELENNHNLYNEKMSLKVKNLEEELKHMQSNNTVKHSNETSKYESNIADEKARYLRLEMEHSLIQRESGKKEVRCKGLQRDVIRLQAAIATAVEETTRLNNDRENENITIENQKVFNQAFSLFKYLYINIFINFNFFRNLLMN
jgi:hypothetical protein